MCRSSVRRHTACAYYNPLMSPLAAAVLLLVAAYLIGALPFGYLIGRMRGVNLFAAGSGNIGATNAARVLGLLDPAGLPVSGGEQAARLLDPSLPSNELITKG